MKLLIRPRPINGESWPSFLIRLAKANHFEGFQEITALFDPSPGRFLCNRSPADVLSRMGYEFDPSWDFPASTPTKSRFHPARAGRTFVTRFCPNCVEAMSIFHVPALWDSALYVYCSTHKRLLIDQCPRCRSPISYLQPDLRRCSCGCSLLSQPLEEPDFDLGAMFYALSLPSIETQSRSTFAPSTEQEIHAAWLLGRLYGVQTGNGVAVRKARYQGNAFLTHADLSKVSSWFENWPDGFLHRLAEATQQYRLGPATAIRVRRQYFDTHFPRIFALFAEHSTRRNRQFPRGPIKPDSGGFFSLSDLKTETWIGVRTLMGLTSCTTETVRQWLESGWLTDVQITHYKNGRPRVLINRQSADHLIQAFRSSVSARSIAQAIGFPSVAIQALAYAGVFQGIRYGEVFRRIRVIPDEVHAYMRSLMKAVIRVDSSHPDSQRLSKFILSLHERNRPLLVPFMQAVMEQRVATYIADSTSPSLDEICVRKSDVRAWMTMMKAAK